MRKILFFEEYRITGENFKVIFSTEYSEDIKYISCHEKVYKRHQAKRKRSVVAFTKQDKQIFAE